MKVSWNVYRLRQFKEKNWIANEDQWEFLKFLFENREFLREYFKFDITSMIYFEGWVFQKKIILKIKGMLCILPNIFFVMEKSTQPFFVYIGSILVPLREEVGEESRVSLGLPVNNCKKSWEPVPKVGNAFQKSSYG